MAVLRRASCLDGTLKPPHMPQWITRDSPESVADTLSDCSEPFPDLIKIVHVSPSVTNSHLGFCTRLLKPCWRIQYSTIAPFGKSDLRTEIKNISLSITLMTCTSWPSPMCQLKEKGPYFSIASASLLQHQNPSLEQVLLKPVSTFASVSASLLIEPLEFQVVPRRGR